MVYAKIVDVSLAKPSNHGAIHIGGIGLDENSINYFTIMVPCMTVGCVVQ